MRNLVWPLLFVGVALGMPDATVAQISGALEEAKDPTTPESGDVEAEVDAGLKRFGYLAGLAHGCVSEKQRDLLDREVVDLHAGIARLMGSDRSFLFAAAYGYGTSIEIEVKECTAVIEAYDERVTKHRANTGGAR
jgi:hypothetical protein